MTRNRSNLIEKIRSIRSGEDNDALETARSEVETIVRELSDELRATLALLHAVENEVAELTLALLPFGSRSALVGYGVIKSDVSEKTDQAVEVELTPLGREVIAAAALAVGPTVVRERLAALDEARAQRAAEQPEPAVRAVRSSE